MNERTEISERPVSYAYRPSAFGPLRVFTLSGDGIDWIAGVRSGHVAYRNIRHLRLSYRPTSMQSQRFVLELWGESAPKLKIASSSWKSLAEQERLDQAYSVFVRELHARLSQAASPTRFERGSNPLIYWPSFVLFAVVGLGLAALVVRALQAGAVTSAALVSGFFVLYLWQGGNFIRRNRPGTYRADALPKDVLPPLP